MKQHIYDLHFIFPNKSSENTKYLRLKVIADSYNNYEIKEILQIYTRDIHMIDNTENMSSISFEYLKIKSIEYDLILPDNYFSLSAERIKKIAPKIEKGSLDWYKRHQHKQ